MKEKSVHSGAVIGTISFHTYEYHPLVKLV
jgi:hypothetical protein